MATRRRITGTGHAINPVDVDDITVQLGSSEGTLRAVSSPGMFVGHLTYAVGGKRGLPSTSTSTLARSR